MTNDNTPPIGSYIVERRKRGPKPTSERVQRNCLMCGAEFTAKLQPGRANRPGHGTLCSKPCQTENLRRKKSAKQKATFEARFWARVDQSGGPDACWPWTGTLDKAGYGEVSRNDVRQRAPRIAHELTKGKIPPSLHACHHCDNPPCCNPTHLYAGTPANNMEDRYLLSSLPLAERRKIREAARAA